MTRPRALGLEDVHKSFGKREVLRGIDLAVAEHEVVCLIGASGSGKSTLLRCVNLLEPIDAGGSSSTGEEITAPRRRRRTQVRRRIGIVFQAFNLFPHMTVLAQRDARRRARRSALAAREARGARRWSCSRRFGLADKARRLSRPAVGRPAAARRDRARAGDAAAS